MMEPSGYGGCYGRGTRLSSQEWRAKRRRLYVPLAGAVEVAKGNSEPFLVFRAHNHKLGSRSAWLPSLLPRQFIRLESHGILEREGTLKVMQLRPFPMN